MTKLQGYATVWDQAEYVAKEGIIESIAPGAIILGSRNITLRAVSHRERGTTVYASTGDQSLRFWNDEYGLAFSAELNDSPAARGLILAIKSGMEGASVMLAETVRLDSGRVINSRISHVCVCADPVYRGTGVWFAETPVRERSAHAQALFPYFFAGVCAHEESRRAWSARAGARHGAAGVDALSRRAASPSSVQALLRSPAFRSAAAVSSAAAALYFKGVEAGAGKSLQDKGGGTGMGGQILTTTNGNLLDGTAENAHRSGQDHRGNRQESRPIPEPHQHLWPRRAW